MSYSLIRAIFCILCLAFCTFLSAVNGEAEVKHHKITVGMYNTYSSRDGNLGDARPDLREVWEGAPGVSEFEACNITMHYWPRPEDLEYLEAEENKYSAWWKDYMTEAYNLTSQDGEVRLRVIVGPLYEYYATYKGSTFNRFVEDLCKWEKDSKYIGTFAGWYLVEEPMGSAHNFDPGINSEMAEVIKKIEDSVGVPHHKMYIDISIGGKYYNSSKLASFTRPADVVMISANTFLWETSGKQPVYEPDWNRIHVSTSQVRDIVYEDRDRRKMPRPEIHAILEARDAMGHGQPTNREMRQQIHEALSYSSRYKDPPADGIWFFWWSEVGLNRKNDNDDWNHGRRIADAIQTQVPRSTFAENSWKSGKTDPDKTRFRLPESGTFNPTYSCIPYDLAEPGYVRVEVLSENMSLLKEFDMNYQVSGEIRRFAGPYWQRGSARNGLYVFRLYVDSTLMDEIKVKVQWSITVNSISHQPGVWSSNNVVDVQWEPQPEELEGLDGYSILWDISPYGYPEARKNLSSEITSLRSDPLPDGDNNYFHIRSVNGADQWSTAIHIGPFCIDTTEPGSVRDLVSDSHEPGVWSRDNRVTVQWNPAEDASSGIMGYSVLWDNVPGSLPDKEADISGIATFLGSEPLADGEYYLHIRSVDRTGNWSHTAAHIGPFLIDTLPPDGVQDLASVSHVPGRWSSDKTVIVNWKDAVDLVSGIAGYSVLWDSSMDTMPDESMDVGRENRAVSPALESSGDQFYYFHIRSVDKTGNWAEYAQHIGPFMIDAEPPSQVEGLTSPSHEPDKWSSSAYVDVTWNPAVDSVSGIARYEWAVLHDAPVNIIPDEWKSIQSPHIRVFREDGLWSIYVRAVDNTGNVGPSEHIKVKVDSSPPTAPVIRSSSHPEDSVWYTDMEVAFEWSAEDKTSGIDGYKWSWGTELREGEAPAEPDEAESEETENYANTSTFIAESAGIWYFHVQAVDKAGNWSEVSRYKVQVDPSAPAAPQISSETHRISKWTPVNELRLSWETLMPGPSGVLGYSFSLDHQPLSIPDEVPDFGDGIYRTLTDGVWYFHCRAKGGSGIWGQAAHFEVRIDAAPPEISIAYPLSDRWYTEPVTRYSGRVYDLTSGIEWYSFEYSFNNGPWMRFAPDKEGETWSDDSAIPHCQESVGDMLRVRVRDNAGNLAVSDPIIIKVDRSIAPPIIISNTHPDQDRWYSANSPDFAWDFSDSISGADGYSWALDHLETTIPSEIRMIEGNITFKTDVEDLSDGIWYFHLRGRDKAGNWSETSHYRIKIDSAPPTARLEITGPAVRGKDPPVLGAGPVEILLRSSEAIYNLVLEYKTASTTIPVPVKLTPTSGSGDKTEWRGAFDVTLCTGDGEAKFAFSARDVAGNTGREITLGGSFVVDTLIPADAEKPVEVLCVTEPGTRISIPPGAASQDLRIEIVKNTKYVAYDVLCLYNFAVYDDRMREINSPTFRVPVKITFYLKPSPEPIGAYYWDDVKWHKIQDCLMQDSVCVIEVDYLGRFALLKTEPVASNILHGWAAPNPFTPNGSGDATDRTIFHVATGGRATDFTVSVYDINGRLVKSLEQGMRAWDGTDEDGDIVEGGLYIYQIHSGDQIISGTVVVLK